MKTNLLITPLSETAQSAWQQLSPFWRGAGIGLLIFFTLTAFITGWYFVTGLSPWLTTAVVTALGITGLLVLTFLFRYLFQLLKPIPLLFLALFLATVAAVIILREFISFWPDTFFYTWAGSFMLAFLLGTGALVTLFNHPGIKPKRLATASLFVSFAWIIAGTYWVTSTGHDPYPTEFIPPPAAVQLLEQQGVPSPLAAGTYKTEQFSYGSGTDPHRLHFGKAVRYSTPSVDATHLLPKWKGKKKKWRERYWGFGLSNFPLNGIVYAPIGEGPFPIVLMVHGNHTMEDFSEEGYAYLGQHLASRGFIAVSVDENFINGTWSGDFRGKEMPARAWLLLKHLEQWRSWNQDSGHALQGKADLDNVLLMGHSRGGEAVAIAAAYNTLPYFPDNTEEPFNFQFGIKGVIALAPTDYRYFRKIKLENINYLSLQGSYDDDESGFFGLRQLRRIEYTPQPADTPGKQQPRYVKAGVYIQGANHGQFNSTWGRYDYGGMMSRLLNTYPMISGEEQRKIAKAYVTAFAEQTVHEKEQYKPFLQYAGTGVNWLPGVNLVNTYYDSETRILQDYEEDLDVTQGRDGLEIRAENLVVWKEEKLTYKNSRSQDNHAVTLGWNQASPEVAYTLKWAEPLELKESSELLFAAAAGDVEILPADSTGSGEESAAVPDFTVELIDGAGNRSRVVLSSLQPLQPRYRAQYLKPSGMNADRMGPAWEPNLGTYRLPVKQFVQSNPALNPSFIQSVRFVFDQTNRGVVVLDEIGVQ